MKVKLSDIPENLHNMYEIVGEKSFVELAKLYGGQVMYFPTYKSVIRCSRNREIIKRYNGVNAQILAREYRVSVSYIRKIINTHESYFTTHCKYPKSKLQATLEKDQ